jgi:hypothetical protein
MSNQNQREKKRRARAKEDQLPVMVRLNAEEQGMLKDLMDADIIDASATWFKRNLRTTWNEWNSKRQRVA